LPQGKLIKPNMVTEDERRVLEAGGWKDGDPVPDNLADFLAQQQEQMTNPDLMPPPVAPNTPPVNYQEVDIDDLSPEEREHTKQAIASVLKGAKAFSEDQEEFAKFAGHDPSVLEAAKLAGGTVAVNDLDNSEYDTGVPKPEPVEETPHDHEDPEERCARCGWPRDKEDVIEVTEGDKDLFLQAILGGKQFHKTIELYSGKLKLIIRTLTPAEHDACWRQVTIDWGSGRVKNLVDQGEMLTRYRAVLQVVAISGLDRPVSFPSNMEDWKALCEDNDGKDTFLVEAIHAFENALVSESLNRMVVGSVSDFNMLVTKMEANSVNPDF
jgi:hypothetical protein